MRLTEKLSLRNWVELLRNDCRPLYLSPGPFSCSEALAPLAGQALNPGTGGTGHVHSHLTYPGQLPQHQAVIRCLILTDLKHHNFPFSALPLPSIAKQTQGTAAVQTGYETFSWITPQKWCANVDTSSRLVYQGGGEKRDGKKKSGAGDTLWSSEGGGENWSSSKEEKARNSKLQNDTVVGPV